MGWIGRDNGGGGGAAAGGGRFMFVFLFFVILMWVLLRLFVGGFENSVWIAWIGEGV